MRTRCQATSPGPAPPVEVTATLFYSRVDNALDVQRGSRGFRRPDRESHAADATREARNSSPVIDARTISTSSSRTCTCGPRKRQTTVEHARCRSIRAIAASFDLLWRFGASQIGIEAFYTGHQALDETPFAQRGSPYVLWGGLLMHRLGRAQLYLNAENLGDVRQTKSERLLLQQRASDGRWSTDAWAPLEGRTINAGLRFRF